MKLSLQDEEVLEYVNTIFSAVLVGGIEKTNESLIREKREVFQHAIVKFKERFRECIFPSTYAVFYDIIIKSNKHVFSATALESIIENNSSEILGSPFIDFSLWEVGLNGNPATDDEKIQLFKQFAVDDFIRLSNEKVYLEDFEAACEAYIEMYYEAEYKSIVAETFEISNGIELRDNVTRSKFKGVRASRAYFEQKVRMLDDETSDKSVRAITRTEEWLKERIEARQKKDTSELLMKIGIDEVDKVIGHLKRTNILEFMGPTKGGKTKMCAYVAEKALSEGLNVAVWPLEGTDTEWDSMILASLIKRKYNKVVPSKLINSVNIDNNDILKLIIGAETELASGAGRGKLTFLSGSLYVETFIEELEKHYNQENPFDLIIIDSLLLALSTTKKGKAERIGEAYVLLKDYLSNKMKIKAAAILTAQLKPAVVVELLEGKKDDIDVTSGAESAETIRTPDYVIGLFSTKQERAAQLQRIFDVANRHSESFETSYIKFDYSCCFAQSDPGLN